MDNLIDAPKVSLPTIASLLDHAGIDYIPNDDDSLYVTGFKFNFWVRLDHDSQYLIYWTYADVNLDAGDVPLLRFVNDCNDDLVLVQFSYDDETHRFKGTYIISFKDGLVPPQITRLGSLFAGVFNEAVDTGIIEGLLKPLAYSGESDRDVADDAGEAGEAPGGAGDFAGATKH